METRNNSLLLPLLLAGTIVVASLLSYGCGGGGGGGGSSSSGTLSVAITDKPSDDYQAVVVSIKEIRVVPAGRENANDNDPGLPVVATFNPPRTIDIMQLHFLQMALGEVVLPAGVYNQLRLILEANPSQGNPVNYLTLKSDPNTMIGLDTPSGQQSGLKINGKITVTPGVLNAILIDFDPNTAIVARGNGQYNLKPQGIRIVQLKDVLNTYGSIAGIVSSTFKDWSTATISIKRRGGINDTDPIAAGTVFSNYTSSSWQAPFTAFVPPNTPPNPPTFAYKTFISAKGFNLYSSSAVNVSQNQTTDLGRIQLINAP
jgi:hypothetical protein